MRLLLSSIAGLMLLASPAAAQLDYVSPPNLDAMVADGTLPPIEERLPVNPYVVDLGERGQELGHHGGSLVTLMSRGRDTRQMYVYGYSRLVKYDLEFNLVPDILESFDIEDGGRSFTFHLREGHRWSDGHPFTTEDFRYFWEDMANNEDLYGSGPPTYLQVRGNYPTVEIIDETTIRYAWPDPNPDFLPGLAQANPTRLYAPSHFMQQFHPNYVPLEELEAAAEEAGQRNWAAIHIRAGRYYRMENPDLPTLQPWYPTTLSPADRFIFLRNPYYHKVDENGLQLPYIDQVIFNITEASLIAGKSGTGDVDLQGRYLRFDDVTLLKRNEEEHGFRTLLWRIAKGSHAAILPNLTTQDPVWREVVRDTRFRQALSMGINRTEINRVIYFGLAIEGQNSMLPGSPLYREEYQSAYTQYDPDAANALLDEMGLRRIWTGERLGPDGEPLEIIVETGGSTEHADILELIKDSWWELGIQVFIKPLGLDSLRRRIFSGQTQMTVFSGIENGLANERMAPNGLAPTTQAQYHWSEWGEYFETNRQGGAAPDMEIGTRLMALLDDWYQAENDNTRRMIWEEMLQIHAEELPTIGIVAGVLQPIVVRDGLMNLPDEGLWNWDPGSHFGFYGLDHVYWAEGSSSVANRN